MAEVLKDYIEKCSMSPWEWGEMDCVLFTAGWVIDQRGFDIASTIRGKYKTMREAQRLIKRMGGFVQGIGAYLDTVLERTASPVTGDIGIVDAPLSMRGHMPVCGAVMAIRQGDLWVCRTAHGAVAADLQHIAAWRV